MIQRPFQVPCNKNIDPTGVLSAYEITKHTGICFKRFFIVSNVSGGIRGGHAHKYTHQVICCLQGSFSLHLQHQGSSFRYLMCYESLPVYTPPLTWVDMLDISTDCIIMVLSSDEYNIANSLRSFSEYLSFNSSFYT